MEKMNREIKFRGLDKNGRWQYGMPQYKMDAWLINDTWEIPPSMQDPCGDTIYIDWEVDPQTVSQFTGLIDKNGKDIYEGDIVKDSMQYLICWGEFNCDEYTFVGWILRHNDKRVDTFGTCQRDANVLEVIGNIYENPELLK